MTDGEELEEILDRLCRHVANGGRVIMASDQEFNVGDLASVGFEACVGRSVHQFVKAKSTRQEWLENGAAWRDFTGQTTQRYFYEIELKD